MTLDFPRDLVLDAYLGRWVEITALGEDLALRQVEPVTVTWGLPNEQARALAPPSTVEGVLNNTGGHWTPGNPTSDYYDYLQGRNVPTRLGLVVARDTFDGRTVVGDWDTSSAGDPWSFTTSGTGTLGVSSGVGTHTQPNAAAFVMSYLGDRYVDGQVAATGSWNYNVAGGSLEPVNLVARYQPSGPSAGEHYLLRVSVSTAEVLSVAIHHAFTGGSNVIAGPVTVAFLPPGANSYRAKFQVEGQTLRGKVYPAGPVGDPDQFEPLDWQVSAHDELLSDGFYGVRTGVASGNTNIPVTVSYEDFVMKLMRHTGELTKLQPTWDESHRIKKAAIKMADITQRLGRPERPALSSAIRRYAASNAEFTTVDFWPLDELPTAPVQGLNAVSGGATAIPLRNTAVTPNRGAITWGVTDRVLTSVPAFVGLNNGQALRLLTRSASLTTSASVTVAIRPAPDTTATLVYSFNLVDPNFVVYLTTSGTYEIWALNTGLGTLTQLSTGAFLPDNGGRGDLWGTIGLTLFANGAGNIGYHLNIDGTTLGVGNWNLGGSYLGLARVSLLTEAPATGGQGSTYFSSVVVTATRLDTIISGTTQSIGSRISNVIKGWPGESALARAYRLCAEEGVPLDYWGDLGDTRAMGPQRPIPLLDQLTECAEVDGALLYAPRYTAGVAFRGRRAMAGRSADAELSYADGHVAPQFAPSADDRPTANLVRAERIDGGFTIVEQTSGPMNTANPGTGADSVGKSPADVKVNAESDAQLSDVGGWVRALGTVPEVRFPKVTVNLAARTLTTGADPTLPARQVLNLRPGDRLAVTGMTAADIYRDLDQMVRGGREVYGDAYRHVATFNTAPYEKYRAGIYGDGESRYDGAVTTLDSSLSAGVTGARNVTTSSGQVWTTAAGAFPLDVVIGGERCTVSGITGSGAAQVMTISARAVNGVAKTHPAGTRVYLHQPAYYG